MNAVIAGATLTVMALRVLANYCSTRPRQVARTKPGRDDLSDAALR